LLHGQARAPARRDKPGWLDTMKHEITPEAQSVADLGLPQAAIAAHATLEAAIAQRSLLVWEEHCSECAYPACYAHCSFYSPRSDLHCRRLEAGFEPIAGTGGFSLVRMRKWAKIEAVGPLRLFTSDAASEAPSDRWLEAISRHGLLPTALRRKLARRHTLRQRRRASDPAEGTACLAEEDSLVIECLSADGRDHDITITLLASDQIASGMFQTHMRVSPDYGRLVIPLDAISAQVNVTKPFLIQIETVGEAAGRSLVFGFCDFVRWKGEALPSVQPKAEPVSHDSRPAKVLVWDLDETLWHGVLAEDGIEGIRLKPDAVSAIKELDGRGILQSIASKNDHDAAMAALKLFGLDDYFLFPQIGWDRKSQAIGNISQSLNLGLDSFVFIDDQPFERAEVTNSYPEVRVLSHDEAGQLAGMACFDMPVTEESRRRRLLYREEETRQEAAAAAGPDYRSFLRKAALRLTLEPLAENNLARVQELSQRTNQLNFTGAKLSQENLKALILDPKWVSLCLRCSDVFGDYGLIGFVMFALSSAQVSVFFMSCRVQKKRVEHALFQWLREAVRSSGSTALRVDYVETARNATARQMLVELGFTPENGTVWTRSIDYDFPDADLVDVEGPPLKVDGPHILVEARLT